jgi:hypothetical protein
MEADEAVKDIVAVFALKASIARLKERGKLGAGWDSISPQMMPKESLMAKPAGLSETQVDDIKKSVEKALGAIKL